MLIIKKSLTSRLKSVPVLLIYLALTACATDKLDATPMDSTRLLGAWRVDLRPTPDSEPYYQALVVTSVEANSFAGTFYGTDISQARINTDWRKIRIAFVTVDGSGEYHHSAVLEGDTLEGLSNSTGRGFLSYWSAVKR